MNQKKLRRYTYTGALLFLSLSCLSTTNADEYNNEFMGMPHGSMARSDMGMDMGMGMGMMEGRFGPGMLSTLDLNKEQQEKINKLHDDMRKEHWGIRGNIMDLQAKLRDVYQEERPDPKAVGDIYEKISKLKRGMIESRVAAMNKVRDVLTSEQQKQLNSQERKFGWRGGPMMRHGWRYSMDN
ncbi:MAG: Spy/CpxP family protein refolding chaperone [Gammaproteobacteria bacterium]|nr:Spy/CpxP family protein refolding chaperone [Gammaproteobacteria bacterium]